MDWDKLKVFHAAAEAGSFTHAGEQLGLSQSAVSRQVSALEQELSVSLFHRHARGLILTEQGELLHRTAHDVFMKLEAARAKLTDSKERPNGELKVSTTPGIGVHWLTPRLGEFIDLYPDIHITLITTDEELDLADARGRRGDQAAPADAARPDPAQAVLGALPCLCLARISQAVRHPADARGSRQPPRPAAGRHGGSQLFREPALADRGRPQRQGRARAGPHHQQRARRPCGRASAASGSRCCRTIWSRRTAGWCSCSANPTRSRSTPISPIRKSSKRWRACRCFAISWSPKAQRWHF